MSDPSTRGRRNRQRGREFENEFVAWCHARGIAAERVSRTGSPGDDVIVSDEWRYEIKGRRTGKGFAMLERWLGDNDALVLRVGGRKGPAIVVLTPEHWAKLVLG